MTDRRLAGLAERRLAVRIVAGIVGAAIGFVIVLSLVNTLWLAVLLGGGVGFLIGRRVANRRWRGGARPDSPYHSQLGGVGRGGPGDLEGPGM